MGEIASGKLESTVQAMDSVSFNKMCLASTSLSRNLGRTDVDLVFQKCRPSNTRRLEYEHFLDALLELSLRMSPDDEPIKGFSMFLAKYLFELFDQPPAANGFNVVDMIYDELTIKSH